MNQRAAHSRPGDRRGQLATAAARLFRERGYHSVGINDIAAAAGVTGPALYRHFTDKQAILTHVVLSGIDEMVNATERALDTPHAPGPERIETLLTRLAGLAVQRREIAALWRWEGVHLGRDGQREVRRRSEKLLDSWNRTLRSLRPELTGTDAELLCWAALSVFGSVAVHRTSVAKRRFETLLTQIAARVLHTRLPQREPSVPSVVPRAAGIGVPIRREQLLTAATELFHLHGYQAVSMQDIGQSAGIAGPSVYRHFPSKAALLTAICKRAAERLMVGADEALRGSDPPDERARLRTLVESYVHTLLSSPELAVSFSTAPQHIDEADRSELLRVQRDYVRQWIRLYRGVRPDLRQHEAKITIHAALTVANDLGRTRRITCRPHLEAELVALLCAALDID